MIPDKYMEMIHKAVFDAVTDKERGELEEYLGKNPEARALYDDMTRMSGILSGAPDVVPPASLKKRILNLVEATRQERVRADGLSGSKATRWKQRGGIVVADAQGRKPLSRRTGWLIGGGVAVVAIVLVIAFIGQQPSEDSARGTIGGAEKAAKYRAGQIGEVDVVLENPEFQQLLQNDKVQDLVRSPEFQTLMNDAAFLALLNDAAFVALMSEEKFVELLGDAKLTDLMSSAKYNQAVGTYGSAAKALLAEESFAQVMGAAPKQFAGAVTDPAFAAFMAEPKAAALLEAMSSNAVEALGDRAVQKVMMNDAFRALAASEPSLPAFMSEPELIQLMSDPKFVAQASTARKLIELKSFQTLAQILDRATYRTLGSEVKSAQVLKLLGSNDFQAFMSSAVYRQMPGDQARSLVGFIGNSATLKLFNAATMRTMMESQPRAMARFLSQPQAMAAVAKAPQLVVELAGDPKFVALANEPRYRQALASHQAQMAEVLLSSQFRQYFGSQMTCATKLLNNPTLKQVMLSEVRMPKMMADQAFMQIMSEPRLRQQFYEAMPKMAR